MSWKPPQMLVQSVKVSFENSAQRSGRRIAQSRFVGAGRSERSAQGGGFLLVAGWEEGGWGGGWQKTYRLE